MKLIPVHEDDLSLYESMFLDPEYMRDLGGVQPSEKVVQILRRQTVCQRERRGFVFKIVAETLDWERLRLSQTENETEDRDREPESEKETERQWNVQTGALVVDDVPSSSKEEEKVDECVRGVAVGTVCLWTGFDDKRGVEITEIGWGIVRKFQRQGFATKALRIFLHYVKEKEKEEKRWGVIHAYTSIHNEASKRLCARVGFELLEETDMEYDGRHLPAYHYVFDTSVN